MMEKKIGSNRESGKLYTVRGNGDTMEAMWIDKDKRSSPLSLLGGEQIDPDRLIKGRADPTQMEEYRYCRDSGVESRFRRGADVVPTTGRCSQRALNEPRDKAVVNVIGIA